MLYVVHAYDGTDEAALDRRMAVRPTHLDGVKRLKERNHYVLGGALLNPDGQMIGSMMLLDFETDAQLQDWLLWEPYVQKKVWQTIDIKPFRQAQV
ncbi:MAG: YciI family protein [Rudanella sp.]|nr:YciI family protein [Rudanella sp.]